MRKLLKAIGISSLIMLAILLTGVVGGLIIISLQSLGMSQGIAFFVYFMLCLFVVFTILAYKY